jgi:hypothetical protein
VFPTNVEAEHAENWAYPPVFEYFPGLRSRYFVNQKVLIKTDGYGFRGAMRSENASKYWRRTAILMPQLLQSRDRRIDCF